MFGNQISLLEFRPLDIDDSRQTILILLYDQTLEISLCLAIDYHYWNFILRRLMIWVGHSYIISLTKNSKL
jgi:hypothetical protein